MWGWTTELQGYWGASCEAEAQTRGLSASRSSSASPACLPSTPPGCHRGPAALLCLPERGRDTHAAAAGVTDVCPTECNPHTKHGIWRILEAGVVACNILCFGWFIKMSPKQELPPYFGYQGSERSFCWIPLEVGQTVGSVGIWGGLVFYEKQYLRWRWRGNPILFAVRGTRSTSQQNSVCFLQTSVSGGKFGPYVDTERAWRSWQDVIRNHRHHRLIRFLHLISSWPMGFTPASQQLQSCSLFLQWLDLIFD